MGQQKLILEGPNDKHVIENLCATHLPRPKGYESRTKYKHFVEIGGGDNGVLELLDTSLATVSDLTNIGVVMDCDLNFLPNKRWDAIKKILVQNGYSHLPKEISSYGITIIQDNLTKIGLWVMPDNTNSGYLEHFYEQLISPSDKMLIRAKSEVAKIIQEKENRFSETHRQKAIIHTWLSWQETVGLPLGTAMNKSYINKHTPIALKFIEWMKNTFDFEL